MNECYYFYLLSVWILGISFLLLIKFIHCIVFFIIGHDCFLFHSKENSPLIKYRLWLGLGLNAFTCGLMLGTSIYHLIPHVRKKSMIYH